MLSPKRTKFRKQHRGRMTGKASKGNTITFGDYALQALEPVWLTSRQIEATRRTITRYVKRGGKLWIRVFPDKPVTARPAETRMGSGKGAPEYWVAVAMKLASYKLPIKTKFITKVKHEITNI